MNVRCTSSILRCAPVLVASMVAHGCAGPALIQRADTLAPGRVQGHVSFNIGGAVDGQAYVPLPTLAASLRVGVADGVDVGLSAWNSGLRADAKLRLFTGDRVTLSTSFGLEGQYVTLSFLGENGRRILPGGEGWMMQFWSLPFLFQLEESGFALVFGIPFAIGYYHRSIDEGLSIDTGLAIGLDLYTGSDTSFFIQTAVLTHAGGQGDVASESIGPGPDGVRVQLFLGGYFGSRS